MMKMHNYLAGLVLMLLVGCQNRELSPDDGCTPRNLISVEVIVQWHLQEGSFKPEHGMRLHLYPVDGSKVEIEDIHTDGQSIDLPLDAQYYPVCYDYYDMETIRFRNVEDRNTFEAFLDPVTDRGHNTMRGDETEPVVQEPYPYIFYSMTDTTIWTVELPDDGTTTIRLHCAPRNVLREFTFLIEDVNGVENFASSYGLISGMPEGYLPALDRVTNDKVTIQFEQCVPQKRSTRMAVGNLTGAFHTFYPTEDMLSANRLTICLLGKDGKEYTGTWSGEEVSRQMRSAMTDPDWRTKNKGYDIVLSNNDQINIPDPPAGGFEPDVDGWGNSDVEL